MEGHVLGKAVYIGLFKHITREGRLAHAFAGFDFTSGGNTRRGQLLLLLIEEKGHFKIAALTFSYHLSSPTGQPPTCGSCAGRARR